MLITDPELTVQYVNEAGSQLLGLEDPADVVGRPMSVVTTERGTRCLMDKLPTVLERGFSRGECELRNLATGATIPVEADCFLVRDPDNGTPLGFLSLQRDILQRRTYERELARWADVAASSDDAMFAIDASGQITSWNLAAERVVGETRREAVLTALQTLAGCGEPGAIERLLRGERIPEHEVTFTRADGTEAVASLTMSLIASTADQPAEVSVIARDVTERRRLTEEARELELQLREITQNMREALWLRDLESGQILYTNPGYAQMFGIDREVLSADPWAWVELIHPDDRARARAFAEDEAGTEPLELRFLRDGEVRWALVRPFVITNAAGEPYRRGGLVEDITDSKRDAERLRVLADHRRRLIAQALDAEERARSRISAALHDEVLQLLLAAGQDLDETLDSTSSEAVARARDTLQAAVGELRAAVRDLHPLVLDHLGPEGAIRQIGNEASRRGGFRFRMSVDGLIPTASARLVVSLARELLSNVARHAGATSAKCDIAVGGGSIRLRVADNGIGLALARLGDALAAGHIGLASARERVEATGGWMTVESEPGAGTTVEIWLPEDR